MLDTHRFLLFLAAALVLAATPGPGIFYVLARTLAGGRREGVQSSLGTFFGGLFHVFAAALGVSAILAASAVAFHTVKYAGAAYLVFLALILIYVAIMAVKLVRIQHEIGELADLAERRRAADEEREPVTR